VKRHPITDREELRDLDLRLAEGLKLFQKGNQMFKSNKATTEQYTVAGLIKDLDAAITKARTARVDSYAIETALEQQLAAHRCFLAASLRF
jgi:hypothetical protein